MTRYQAWFEALRYAAAREGIHHMAALAEVLEMPVTTLAAKCRRAGLRLPGGTLLPLRVWRTHDFGAPALRREAA